MKRPLQNIYWLGIKELFSLRYDPVLVVLIIYAFTIAIFSVSKGATTEVENSSVAVVDEDHSTLSWRLYDALLKPYFKRPAKINVNDIDEAMNSGRYTFVIDIPPGFQSDVLAGRSPRVQLNVDATAMTQAGSGAAYIQRIVSDEVNKFLKADVPEPPVNVVVRAKFNPNLNSSWFLALMQILNNITLLAIILTGAALVREREHGTIEHLLVMPLRPFEIMLAKVWANGLIIVVSATISLYLVVQGLLGVPIAGSIPLFLSGTVIYLFSVTALGIFLATIAQTMPQFGLLAIPVFLVMNLLSGNTTPLESMPKVLQIIMQFSPSTQYVKFSQAVLYRSAGIEVVWPDLAAIVIIGLVLFAGALLRFRKTIAITKQ